MANPLAIFVDSSMDDATHEQPCFRLMLRALPRAVPTVVRLRRLIKTFLRCYGFECVDACELPRQVRRILSSLPIAVPLLERGRVDHVREAVAITVFEILEI